MYQSRSSGNPSPKVTESDNLHKSSISKGTEHLELIFQNLSYSVPFTEKSSKNEAIKDKTILDDISGVFQPGRLTAVMGSSGAGKTTLLSVLAGNTKTGHVEGSILVNGETYSGGMLKNISGFVFQDDVLLPTMTIKEAISMSALLRTPKSVARTEREERVAEIISLLHLESAQNTIVGDPLKKGISGGERKRTAIGMEMVVNPGMLFLDEPTTGLDTFTAFTVILSLSNLAKLGKTVVATIHQPSTEIFKLFDDLLILSRGRVAYFGPAENAVEYFAKLGHQCPQYMNPADFIFMEVLREFGTIEDDIDLELENVESSRDDDEFLAAGTGQFNQPSHDNLRRSVRDQCDDRIEKLLAEWLASTEYSKLMEEISNPTISGVSVSVLRKSAPFWTQFKFLFRRAGLNFLRNTQLIIARLAQSIFLGLVLGLVFIDVNQYVVPVQIRNKSGALFFISTNVFFAAATQILSIFGIEKPVFYREYQAGYYCVGAYYISKTLVEIPGQIIGPFLLVIICYYMIGLNPAFSNYLMVATLGAFGALCGNAYGTLIVALVDDLNIALTIAPICILPLLVVSGVFVAELPGFLNWLKYISPIYYAFSGMLQVEFDRVFPNCDDTREVCDGQRGILELNFSDTFSPGVNLAFLAVIFVTFWIAGWIALYTGARRKA